jgi:hypothetical protein
VRSPALRANRRHPRFGPPRAQLRGAGQAAIACYLTERGALVADSFTAQLFVLYSARAGSGGGPYVVEAAYPLGKGRVHRRSRLRWAGTSRYRDASHFHGLEAL